MIELCCVSTCPYGAFYMYVIIMSRTRSQWINTECQETPKTRCCHLKFRYRACFEQGFLDIKATMECRFTLKRVRDMIKTYSQMHREVITTQLKHLVSFGKWLSVHLRTKWLWIRIPLLSLKSSSLISPYFSLPFFPSFLFLMLRSYEQKINTLVAYGIIQNQAKIEFCFVHWSYIIKKNLWKKLPKNSIVI